MWDHLLGGELELRCAVPHREPGRVSVRGELLHPHIVRPRCPSHDPASAGAIHLGDLYHFRASILEALLERTHLCTSRLDSECPEGEQRYRNPPCPDWSTYCRGASLWMQVCGATVDKAMRGSSLLHPVA